MAHFSIISSQSGEEIFEGAPRYVGAYLKPGYLEFSEIGSPTAIDWHVGDYIVYSRTGKTYRLYRTPQTVEQGNTQRNGAAFLYENVQFFDDSKQLEFCPFTDLVPGDNTIHFSTQNTVSFFGKPLNVAERLQACLEAQYGAGSWTVRIVSTTDADLLELLDTEVEFSVSGVNCQQVLDKVYELWNGLGWIHSVENGVNVITIGASNVRISTNTTVPFAYDNGLVRVERSIANADRIGTRLYAYGSMKNMDATYYRGLNIKDAESVDIEHLMIPLASWGLTDGLPDARKAYIENATAIAALGLIPRTAYFDGTGDLPDIHPTIERMTIGEVYDAGGAGYLPNLAKWSRSQRIDEVVSASNPSDRGTSAEQGQKYAENFSSTIRAVSEAFIDHDWLHATIYSATLDHGGKLTLRFGNNRQIFTLDSSWEPTFNLRLVINAGNKTHETPLTVVRVSSTSYYIELPESVTLASTIAGSLEVFIDGYIGQENDSTAQGGRGTFTTDSTTAVSGGVEYEIDKTFSLTIPQIGFDIDNYADLGNGKTISMKTGMCAGRDFEIKDAAYDSSSDSWRLTIYRSVDEDLNIMFPNADYQIAAGDQYVLLDIAMPEMYVTVASQRLLAAAQRLLADISIEQPYYAPQIDAKVVFNESRILREGMWMDVTFDSAREYVLIDSITIDENGSNIPTYEVALREKKGLDWTENVGKSSSSRSSSSVNERTAQPASGTVTSVGLTAPDGMIVVGSPVTGAGILQLHLADGYIIPLESQLIQYFRQNANLSSLVELKPDYSYLGPRKGLIFEVNSETYGEGATQPDLYVITKNGQRVLYSPLPLITGGDQIVIDGDPQEGGGGGGKSYLHELLDIYGHESEVVKRANGSNRADGDLLAFNSSLGKWVALAQSSIVPDLTGYATETYVNNAIDALPEPMIFKGSLGTGGTITSLPAASSANEGFTYKVITAGTYSGIAAKVGDTFISNGSSWVLIPSGDEPEGTVTSVGLSLPTGLTLDTVNGSASPITDAGTFKIVFSDGYSIPTTAKQAAWDAKYDKPSGGIPNTDLANSKITIGTTVYNLGDTKTVLEGLTKVSLTNAGELIIGGAKLTWVAPSGDTPGYLKIDQPLVTSGDQIVISGTPGGGSGGGASNLYQLDDVSVSSCVSGDVLYYNGSKWVNKPASEIGGVTSVAGQTGDVTTAQIATALTGAGYKLTDTVITDYWKTGDSRTKNTVLAAPSSANGAASFRALVAADIPSLAISKITNLQTTLDGKVSKAGDTMTGALTMPTGTNAMTANGIDFGTVGHIGMSTSLGIYSAGSIYLRPGNGELSSSYGLVVSYDALTYNGNTVWHAGNFTPGNYVLKAGDTMTGNLIIEKTGGGLTIRGERDNANNDGGYIYLAARYYSHDRNGVKIAAVYPGSGAYDIQDLVFYSSRNVDPNSDASPIWEESMRIKSTKAVIIAASLAIGTTLSVSGLATLTGGAVIPSAKTLKIGDATISWVANSGNGYLKIDRPLVTSGDQIVISGTPGEGGGGGKSRLSELLDVDKSISVGANKLLVYNTSVTSNAGTTGGWTATALSAGTGISISGLAISLTQAIQTNIANGQTAYGWGNHASAGYVLLATAQTITAKHTFSNGLILNTASSWSSSDRALYFAAHDDDTNLRYYYTDASKGLTFNPNTGALKAGSFVKRGSSDDYLLLGGGGTLAKTGLFTALSSDSSDLLSITVGGTTKKLTTLYATVAKRLTRYVGTDASGGYDLNTLLAGGGITSQYSSAGYWANGPSGMSYGSVAQINASATNTLCAQIAWDINHNSATPTRRMWWRAASSTHGWQSDWHLIYDSSTLTQSVLTGLLGTHYLPTAGGTMTGDIVLNNAISVKGKTTGGDEYAMIRITSSNNIAIGGTSFPNNVNVYGTLIQLCAGSSSAIATVSSTGLDVTGAVTATGAGTFDTITLTNTSAVAHINFSRASWNYLNAPTSGAVCVSIGGAGSANTISVTNATGIRPGATDTYDLGTSAVRWNNIYGTNGDLAGTLNVTGLSTLIGGAEITSAENKGYRLTGTNYSLSFLLGNGGTNRGIYGYTSAKWLFYFDAANTIANYGNLLPGANATQELGAAATRWSAVYANNINAYAGSGNATITIGSTNDNYDAGKILFKSNYSVDHNGFKIEAVKAASSSNRGRLSLDFYSSGNNTTSPYAPAWKRSLRISYNGNVIIGSTTSGEEFYPSFYAYGNAQIGTSANARTLTVYGNIVSSGDQTVTSDALLKKNWRTLRYGVKDIAGATAGVFDWKDGKGSSAGTKAQDWLRLVPELVHGEEGHMSLAYGQIAMLNTILIAREVVDHEAEIQKLKRRVAELEKQLNLRS